MTTFTVRHWFAIDYTDDANPDMPPIIEASIVFTYSDDHGSWAVAVLEPPHGSVGPPHCILRLPARDVRTVTRHDTLLTAIAAREQRASL